jgi:hypothetical protein
VGSDITLESKFARDDFLDRDFLVPAVAAVPFLAARLGDFFGAAEGTSRLFDGLSRHQPKF